jgi:SAM-dependent methyltransferase
MLLYYAGLSTADDFDGSILTSTGLDLTRLGRISSPPRPFAGSSRSFWTDPYVSHHLLHAHLDPSNDDASRRPEQRAAEIEQILSFTRTHHLEPPGSLLDLACGPGLHALAFAQAGYEVTGIDFSEVSLNYARNLQRREGVAATFAYGDIRTAALGAGHAVVTLIYGAFCMLSDRDRTHLLARIRDALRPGGALVLDAFTHRYAERIRVCNDWYVGLRSGFWQARPHLVLERTHHYPKAKASVVRYVIVREDGRYRLFDVWWRHFSRDELISVLSAAGFRVEDVQGSLAGDRYDPDGEWLAAFCIKA